MFLNKYFETSHKLCERIQVLPPMAVGRCILTWRGSISDQRGVSPKTRPFHCTWTWLTLAITANVGNSTVQFLVVGVCVRAHPLPYPMKEMRNMNMHACMYVCMCGTGMFVQEHTYIYGWDACMHVWVCIHACMNECMHDELACMYVYKVVHMHFCVHVCASLYIDTCLSEFLFH